MYSSPVPNETHIKGVARYRPLAVVSSRTHIRLFDGQHDFPARSVPGGKSAN